MVTPDGLEARFTLLTAAARYDALRTRDALASPAFGSPGYPEDDAGPPAPPLTPEEALEMLALGEVLARKAGYGRQLAVRSARSAGASWSQIGAALGISKQAAWETHGRWIDDQAEQYRRSGYQGLDQEQVAAARALAGEPDRQDRS
ncbi:hypothetical protein [Sphaerisporangium perillae]|uniref:hypothetical protein n=1 Tax=Sphaerisporangium perillae TaxID=2935860 RepID=UPI00200C3A30|nr:hypothetical protein [Sphaerisporangium perillae]